MSTMDSATREKLERARMAGESDADVLRRVARVHADVLDMGYGDPAYSDRRPLTERNIDRRIAALTHYCDLCKYNIERGTL